MNDDANKGLHYYEEAGEYGLPGWYFSDEAQQLHGPHSNRDQALFELGRYIGAVLDNPNDGKRKPKITLSTDFKDLYRGGDVVWDVECGHLDVMSVARLGGLTFDDLDRESVRTFLCEVTKTLGSQNPEVYLRHATIYTTVHDALAHYGQEAVEQIVIGEIGELLTLFGRRQQGRDTPDDWLDETADLILMGYQLAAIHGFEKVEKVIDQKLDTIRDRIKTHRVVNHMPVAWLGRGPQANGEPGREVVQPGEPRRDDWTWTPLYED